MMVYISSAVGGRRYFRIIIFILFTFPLCFPLWVTHDRSSEQNSDFFTRFAVWRSIWEAVLANIVLLLAQETPDVSHRFILIDGNLNHLLNCFLLQYVGVGGWARVGGVFIVVINHSKWREKNPRAPRIPTMGNMNCVGRCCRDGETLMMFFVRSTLRVCVYAILAATLVGHISDEDIFAQ